MHSRQVGFLLAGVGFFLTGALSAQSLYCASDDGGRHHCRVDTRGGVRMVEQVSGSECRKGYSWGWDGEGVWVDHGCRANFVAGERGGPGAGGATVTCNSDDEGRHRCQADTRGGVTMVRQHSGSPCREGYSWGYDRDGIWVDRGCRAEFQLGGRGGGGGWGRWGGGPDRGRSGDSSAVIQCNSDDEHRHVCPADTRGGVTMVRQNSGSPCREGYSWGYTREGIWVDRGCRAEFQLGGGRQGGWRGGPGGPPVESTQLVCASEDGGRHFCPADTRGGVRMTRQHSKSPCNQGQTWGYDNRGIWVDRGCRAEFETGRR